MDGSRPPHILFVTVDQWPARLLGIAGHPVASAKTIDASGADGGAVPR